MSTNGPAMASTALRIRAAHIARIHTVLALLAFFSALGIGCMLHYKKIVKNGVAGYPDEWFPSVSATIGDWYPERNIFQILIAINSGPRFAVVLLQYYLRRHVTGTLPLLVCITGIVRTLSCGGWVYITSTDDHGAHDILMILYIVCNIPWMFGNIVCTQGENSRQRFRRILFASIFFGSLVPMIYFFVQHKVHRIPGAYTRYSFFEWALIVTDVMYDSVTEQDFADASLELSFNCSPVAVDKMKVAAPEAETVNRSSKAIAIDATIASSEKIVTFGEKPENRDSLWSGGYREHIYFLSNVYLGYVFWSIFTALIPTLFYFSIWELGIAGAELALLVILSPSFLGISAFRNWVATTSGRLTIHVLTLPGLLAFLLPKPAQRLLFVAFANVFACIGAASDWSSSTDTLTPFHYAIGLLLSSLSKHANHGNNPVWPMVNKETGGYNWLGLILAIIALLELSTRPAKDAKQMSKQVSVETLGDCLCAALPMGSLIFSLHCFLTDPSTIIAWTWTGYPIKGPVPHIHGYMTLIAQAVGLLLPATGLRFIIDSPLWFGFGASAAYTLYIFKDWNAYIGGIELAVFLSSIIPRVLEGVPSIGSVGKFYFIAFLTAIVLYLANVWTVAYAFVPGGDVLRERSDVVLFAQMIFLSPIFFTTTSRPSLTSQQTLSKFRPSIMVYAFAAVALAGVVSVYRTPSTAIQPYRPGPRIIRAGVWTVHFGLDNEGKDSQRLMRDLIRDLELDVVGLLETDLHRTVYGNRDLTRVMVEDLGFYVDIGPGPNQHTWGAVLLSKFPIINSTHHLLPSPRGELAPAISAYLNCFGTEVLVVVAHNGQEEDPLDRELQSKALARIMGEAYPTPAIFLGYVVTKPLAERPAPYKYLVEDGQMYDIDYHDNDRWCEYILYRGLYRTAYLRMSRGKVTDTELQAGQFVVPRHGTQVTSQSEASRYLNNFKETMIEDHWFPMEYYGNERKGGKNGHFYHVFNTPLYYNLPPDALL